jgi:nitroreductase
MKTVPLEFARQAQDEMLGRAQAFHAHMARRRTVRAFAADPVPRAIVESCLRTAGTAPSGAHQQPWHFVAVSEPRLKQQIRAAAEAEERAFYGGRAPDEWLAALEPLGTTADKPFLEIAPWLIVIFARLHGVAADGAVVKHYYVQESVGIATGLLIAALHDAGLATLTHTPSPMTFLNRLLGRPARERPFLIVVTGYPAVDARVPDLRRKALEEIATFRE